MPDEVERKGIGTSATRAATIEKLVRIGFVERKGNKKTKYLLPTHKGVALITVMPEQIQSPSMTAEWEQKLLDVEKGALRDAEFMNEIEGMITELVRTYKIIEDAYLDLDENKKEYIDEILNTFSRYPLKTLITLTKTGPWKNNYKEGEITIIPAEDIQNYFKRH